MSIDSKRWFSIVSLCSSGREGAWSPKLASESIPLLCTLFLGDLGVLERTKEVFQDLVAMWKFRGLEDTGRSSGRCDSSLQGDFSKRAFLCKGACQRRVRSRCVTPLLTPSHSVLVAAVFFTARRSPAFSGQVIFSFELYEPANNCLWMRRLACLRKCAKRITKGHRPIALCEAILCSKSLPRVWTTLVHVDHETQGGNVLWFVCLKCLVKLFPWHCNILSSFKHNAFFCDVLSLWKNDSCVEMRITSAVPSSSKCALRSKTFSKKTEKFTT